MVPCQSKKPLKEGRINYLRQEKIVYWKTLQRKQKITQLP